MNGASQREDAAERAAPDGSAFERREPSLDGVEPRSARRREVKLKARMLREPTFNLGSPVGAAVVEDDVDGQRSRVRPIDLLQEADELFGSMPLFELGQDLPSSEVEGRVQADRTVPLVVMRASLELPGLQWKHRLRAVECLDLGLLVHRQHESSIRRLHV